MLVDPWSSTTIENYEHVFKKFGLKRFPKKFCKELKHYLFERGIVVAHRDFDKIMHRIKSKKEFINMTGIASSGMLHFGHKVDIDLFKFFKSKKARNYFAVCDIDAYVSRPDSVVGSLEKAKEFALENIKDLLALGLDEQDVYVQSNKETRYYEFAFELSKKITRSTFEAIYGHIDLGKISANLLQYADILHPQLPEFEGKMPSITGIGLEQDPHARATRDIAARLPYNLEMPSFIYFRHQSGLLEGTKMSASKKETAIFLSEKPETAKRKILNAFTGGRATANEQRKKGGKPEMCKVFEFLLFHYPDTKKIDKIFKDCKSGKWLCGECKNFLIEFVQDFLEEHNARRSRFEKTAKRIMGY
ncbi:MAG: tryptophan--tRNA ligase [Candidatus Diapherotrites archaeon]|nr:tryptophan--tRNA ligase [Candidatus Diapherotrites archaeon]